jgi:hypothetical protein
MITKNVDCCHLSAQENEPRVTFTTEFYEDKARAFYGNKTEETSKNVHQ